MAGFRGFPLLFLLPLILGCFLSFSTAGSLNRKRRNDFENTDVLDFVNEGPETEMFYRALLEEADLDTQFPESSEMGYRNLFGKEFVTKIPPFGSKYRTEEETESGGVVSLPASQPRTRYRQLKDKKDFAGEFSEFGGTRYKSLIEKDVVTEIPYSESNFRKLSEEEEIAPQAEEEKLGFRLKFFDELKEVLENFDQKYVDKMTCEEIKVKMSKIVEFLRTFLGFVK